MDYSPPPPPPRRSLLLTFYWLRLSDGEAPAGREAGKWSPPGVQEGGACLEKRGTSYPTGTRTLWWLVSALSSREDDLHESAQIMFGGNIYFGPHLFHRIQSIV